MLRYFECNKGDFSAFKHNAVKACNGTTGETPPIFAVLAGSFGFMFQALRIELNVCYIFQVFGFWCCGMWQCVAD
jgi:hypothetical protein